MKYKITVYSTDGVHWITKSQIEKDGVYYIGERLRNGKVKNTYKKEWVVKHG